MGQEVVRVLCICVGSVLTTDRTFSFTTVLVLCRVHRSAKRTGRQTTAVDPRRRRCDCTPSSRQQRTNSILARVDQPLTGLCPRTVSVSPRMEPSDKLGEEVWGWVWLVEHNFQCYEHCYCLLLQPMLLNHGYWLGVVSWLVQPSAFEIWLVVSCGVFDSWVRDPQEAYPTKSRADWIQFSASLHLVQWMCFFFFTSLFL